VTFEISTRYIIALQYFFYRFISQEKDIVRDEAVEVLEYADKVGADMNHNHDLATPRIGASEKVAILMHEYTALKNEILAKSGFGFQLVAIVAAVAAWLGGTATPHRFWTWMSITVVVIGIASWFIIRDIWECAAQVREIEARVDEQMGEWYLLRSERLAGGTRRPGVLALVDFLGPAQVEPVPPRPTVSMLSPPENPSLNQDEAQRKQ
jgi:hypothetical protein